jgi:hypothetical protein
VLGTAGAALADKAKPVAPTNAIITIRIVTFLPEALCMLANAWERKFLPQSA